jgi:lysine 6-dehydrogenase
MARTMDYLLLGAGLQGTAIAFDLLRQVDDTRRLTVVDRDEAALAALRTRLGADARLVCARHDVTDAAALGPLMERARVVISAVNYWFNHDLARQALAGRAHFLDLGGNNDVVDRELALDGEARRRGVTIVPDCGLAPGMAGILAYDLQRPFERVGNLRLRVGGLPRQPRPPLDYMLVFAVQGLINEYIEPCIVIREGQVTTVPGLSELEILLFPEPYGELEAFQTSGGTSTLPRTLAGRVHNLDYKTIRYPGHCRRFRLLLDLGLMDSAPVPVDGSQIAPRELLGALLEKALPHEGEDVTLMLIQVDGWLASRGVRRTLRMIDTYDRRTDMSAMMRTTGYPAAIIAHMLAAGTIDEPGARPQELVVPAAEFRGELARRRIVLHEEEEPWEPALDGPG